MIHKKICQGSIAEALIEQGNVNFQNVVTFDLPYDYNLIIY
jgi:hypothetical protein